jgi:hypothetical protein
MSIYVSDAADVVEPIDDEFDPADHPAVKSLEELKESTEDDVLDVEFLLNDLREWLADAEALISKIEEAIEDREEPSRRRRPERR